MTTTLAELATEWDSHTRTWNSDACVPVVHIVPTDEHETPVILLGDHPVPFTEHGRDQLLNFYKFPRAFFDRCTRELQDHALNAVIDQTPGEVSVSYTRHGVTEVLKPTQPRLHPLHFIQAARQSLPDDSPVIESWLSTVDLRLDVIHADSSLCAPDGGNIHAGIRLNQNRRQNLAPSVQPILYHTSGAVFQIPDPALKVEARRASVDTIAELLAAEGTRALARTDTDIRALLDLKHQSIATDRITILTRIGTEQGIPARYMASLTSQLSRINEPTMYDLALLIAQAASTSDLLGEAHRGVRTRLQTIAGRLVAEHAERCNSCHARIA